MKDSNVSFHVHHMIPKFSDYFPDLEEYKEEEEYKVRLTIEGHACQHDILYKVFGDRRDALARDGLLGIVGKEDIWHELTKMSSRFKGKKHTKEWKENNSRMMKELHANNPERREQMRRLGKSTHKRNPTPGMLSMSGPNKRQYMRQHWRKEVWDAVKERWGNRTSFHWGKIQVQRQFGVSAKTLDNMLELIQAGVDWHTATAWKE